MAKQLNIEKAVALLIKLLEEQEGVKIEYELIKQEEVKETA